MKKSTAKLSNFFLFRNLEESEIADILGSREMKVRSYAKGEVIFSPDGFEKNIGFVIKGRCEVRRSKQDGHDVVLNTLNQYDSFGVLAAFSCEDFPTEVYAVASTDILFFDKSEILDFMYRNPVILTNVIEFLTSRINFLNKRIATFTCSSVEDKLASFILSEYARHKSVEIAFNCQKTASIINAGRASVYRALATLADAGYIKYDTKKIYINDPKGLERTLK